MVSSIPRPLSAINIDYGYCFDLAFSTFYLKAIIKMYTITDAGMEREYFNIILENVKLTSITPDLYPGASTGMHLETVLLRYEKITWKHCDGNIIYTDEWNHRAVY